VATGYHDFVAGETLTAANLEDFCELQGILTFASAAARNAAVASVLREGLFAYLQDLNVITVYTGAAWSTIGPGHGPLTAWSPTITQSGSVAFSNVHGSYSRVGRRVTANCRLDVTGTGTASNLVTVSLPVTAVTAGDVVIGSGYLFDTSAGTVIPTVVAAVSGGTTCYMLGAHGTGSFAAMALGSGASSGFTAALASGDIISMSVHYEATADA
jgi:hypothetical protein